MSVSRWFSVEVLPESLAPLAGHLVGVFEQRIEAAVLRQPLRRGLGAHTGHARQVVGGLPHQRRDLRVLRGRQPVAFQDFFWGHVDQVRGGPARINDSRLVVDQLERVAVT